MFQYKDIIKFILITLLGYVFVLNYSLAASPLSGLPGFEKIVLSFSNLSQAIQSGFKEINFIGGGNDFLGGVFLTPVLDLSTPVELKLGGETKKCYKQIRGLYLNTARGDVLWPLDNTTLDTLKASNSFYNDLTLVGGLYTGCEGEQLPYDPIYGQLSLVFKGYSTTLSAGISIDPITNSIGNKFIKGLEYFEGVTPMGYIFDQVGGGAFIGGVLIYRNSNGTNGSVGGVAGHKNIMDHLLGANNNFNSINKIFYLDGPDNKEIRGDTSNGIFKVLTDYFGGGNTLSEISLLGNVGVSQGSITVEGKKTVYNLGRDGNDINDNNQRIILFGDENINISGILNKVRKTSAELCQGSRKSRLVSGENISNADFKNNILCIDKNISGNVSINLNTVNFSGKTIITKNVSNFYIKGRSTNNNEYLDLFVDGGKLIIEDITPDTYFDIAGNPVSLANSVTKGVALNGIFIVNGLILGNQGTDSMNFTHKLYIKGKIATLSTVGTPNESREQLVKSLLGLTDNLLKYINLTQVFSWQCNSITGTGTDSNDVKCDNEEDKYRNSPLIVMPKKYETRLNP